MATLNQFNPVGAFQSARQNALTIQGQEQGIAREAAAAPVRSQLAELQLGQAQKTAQRGQTQFDQGQALQRAKIMNQAATALKGIAPENRAGAFTSLLPKLQEFGIDTAQIEQQPLTDENLDLAIFNTKAFLDNPEKAISDFTLSAGQTRFDAQGNKIAGVEPKPPATSSMEKNLIAAGLTPGTPEFEAEAKRFIQKPVGTQITIGGEKKFKEKVAEGQAKTYGRIGEEADAAIDANQSLSIMENIDVETGTFEPAKQAIAAFGSAFGIDTSGLANVSAGEGFNAEAKRVILSVKASQKGPQTDGDEATIRDTVANLGNTKEGNRFIIDSARALNNRRIERKDFYDNFIENAGGDFKDETGKTADRAWSEFKRSTPMLSSRLRTPEGLPVFFYRFEESVRKANPDATREEIIEAWKAADKRTK